MTNKEHLISLCKRYKGEEENPDPMDSIWRYEQFWVEMSASEHNDFGFIVERFDAAGLHDFHAEDNTPITLKAILYNRFMQQAEGMARVEDFKRWYDTYYI